MSATRPRIDQVQVIPSPQGSPANSGSMAANITSAPTLLGGISVCSYSFSWAGTSPIGTISIQGSNDYALNPAGQVDVAGTWNTLYVNYQGNAVTTVPVSGNTGTGLIDLGVTGIRALRAIYTAGSGTGTMTCIFNGRVT